MSIPPKDEQIQAMLEERFFELLRKYIDEEPSLLNYRQYLTVTRRDLIDFLNRHPETANSYFKESTSIEHSDDVAGIGQEGNTYLVFWWDHGRRTSIKRYRNMNEAIAEYVLWLHGIFNAK